MNVLTRTDELAEFAGRAKSAEFLTVDTEFMREKTYYSHLCLIQAATVDEAVIIDPLADDIDLSPFLDLLRRPSLTKVFHAARQDIEIFLRIMGEVPAPLFDTQIAAMVFGFGDQVGYEPIVRQLTGVQIDKGSRFTDWSRRPLSQKQLDYAVGDVTHLRDVYTALVGRLKETDRFGWIEEEMALLADPALYSTEPEDAWKRLKLRNTKPKEMGPLIELAAWREREAQRKDVPRARVVKDDVLFEVARAQPSSPQDLASLRSIPNGFERSASARSMLEAVARGKEMPRDALPKVSHKPKETAPPDVVDLLRVLLKRQCEIYDVAPKLLASASDLDALALSDDADIPALKGWRREVFGGLALELKHGKLALSLDRQSVSIIRSH